MGAFSLKMADLNPCLGMCSRVGMQLVRDLKPDEIISNGELERTEYHYAGLLSVYG